MMFNIEDLRPLYAAIIARINADVVNMTAKIQKDPYAALDWNSNVLVDLAAEHRWYTGMLELCERSAEENDGMVDENMLRDVIDRRLRDIARNNSWTSNVISSHLQRAELSLLSKAGEPFGDELLSPFRRIREKREREAYDKQQRSARWRVASANGKRWMTDAGTWTSIPERAGTWPYDRRPTLGKGMQYEMLPR